MTQINSCQDSGVSENASLPEAAVERGETCHQTVTNNSLSSSRQQPVNSSLPPNAQIATSDEVGVEAAKNSISPKAAQIDGVFTNMEITNTPSLTPTNNGGTRSGQISKMPISAPSKESNKQPTILESSCGASTLHDETLPVSNLKCKCN